MLTTRRGVRVLGTEDLAAFLELTDRDPVVNVFADYRARTTRLDPRWLGGEVWGYFEAGELLSACHVGANLVPVQADAAAAVAFGERAMTRYRSAATIVGPDVPVETFWETVEEQWGPARETRFGQQHMECRTPAALEPIGVRRSTEADFDALYPACVAMYTEEVGVSPVEGGGDALYRVRVRQLISRGWSFVHIEDGRVLFKAEVACASPYAAQIQGVYVDPARRGEGLAARGMAEVAALVLADVAPVASLYVNAWNTPALRAYERAGFTTSALFSTVMF